MATRYDEEEKNFTLINDSTSNNNVTICTTGKEFEVDNPNRTSSKRLQILTTQNYPSSEDQFNTNNERRHFLINRSTISHSEQQTHCYHPIKSITSSLRTFTHQSPRKSIIWRAFVFTIIASIFGQLINVASANSNPLISNNDDLPQDDLEPRSDTNNLEDSVGSHYFGDYEENYPDTNGDTYEDEPFDIGGVEKRGNYLFRSRRGNYLFRSRRVPRYIFQSKRAPSYLFRSKKAPSYLFRSRRSPNEPDRVRKAPGYLFRSRRAPGYLFRSRRAPSYLFRSKKAPSYLFRSRKNDGRQSRSYFFRSRRAPGGYLFRSRRGGDYLFRSRRDEQTEENAASDDEPSISTRAGYLFRTRKSYPTPEVSMSSEDTSLEDTEKDNEDQSNNVQNYNTYLDNNIDPLSRQLRSRSYLFRTKKDVSSIDYDPENSHPRIATRGAYLFRT